MQWSKRTTSRTVRRLNRLINCRLIFQQPTLDQNSKKDLQFRSVERRKTSNLNMFWDIMSNFQDQDNTWTTFVMTKPILSLSLPFDEIDSTSWKRRLRRHSENVLMQSKEVMMCNILRRRLQILIRKRVTATSLHFKQTRSKPSLWRCYSSRVFQQTYIHKLKTTSTVKIAN